MELNQLANSGEFIGGGAVLVTSGLDGWFSQ